MNFCARVPLDGVRKSATRGRGRTEGHASAEPACHAPTGTASASANPPKFVFAQTAAASPLYMLRRAQWADRKQRAAQEAQELRARRQASVARAKSKARAAARARRERQGFVQRVPGRHVPQHG